MVLGTGFLTGEDLRVPGLCLYCWESQQSLLVEWLGSTAIVLLSHGQVRKLLKRKRKGGKDPHLGNKGAALEESA